MTNKRFIVSFRIVGFCISSIAVEESTEEAAKKHAFEFLKKYYKHTKPEDIIIYDIGESIGKEFAYH